MDSQAVPPTAEDWAVAVSALPDIASLDEVRQSVVSCDLPQGGPLPADGLYLVLSGEVSLQLGGDHIAEALGQDYFFEEYLALQNIKSKLSAIAEPGTRLLKLDLKNWDALSSDSRDAIKHMMFGDLVNVHMHDFQQPINCCNVTAVAFGLTALGYPTHVDDIFMECKLPGAYVVNDGMTLGEIFNVACTYLQQRNLKEHVDVHCHYFDEGIVAEHHLLDAILESNKEGGTQDILVANFGVGLAHNILNNDGGHFALIAKCNPSTGIVHMVDVHPEKYGKLWVTNLQRLYKAMAQPDSSSFRSRGLLRFTTGKAVSSKLDSLAHNVSQADMTDHLSVRDENITSFFRDMTTNLSSISTLALSLRMLGLDQVDSDNIMQTLRIPYTEALSATPTTKNLHGIMERYLDTIGVGQIVASYIEYAERDEDVFDWFYRQLSQVSLRRRSQVILNVDINTVMGCSAINLPDAAFAETAMLDEFWCVCIDFDQASGVVTVSDNSVSTSQVWQASIENLLAGFERKNELAIILLERSGRWPPKTWNKS